MKSKKLLIAGGGYADIPLILAARDLGFHTITSGNRKADLGHQYAHESHLEDFSSPEKMLALVKKLKVDFVSPCCNDFSLLSCAFVAEKLSLPGFDSFDVALKIHHKDQYRKFALENAISTPYAMGFSEGDDIFATLSRFTFPIIIKPVDLTGGKGIGVAGSLDEAVVFIEKAFAISKAKRIVVEEFIEGTRHGLSLLLENKKVIFSFSDNEHYFINPYMVSAASTPTFVGKASIDKLIATAESVAASLRLVDGIFHIQFIESESGPRIIEICRRPPGDLYVKFMQLYTGVNYCREVINAFTGMKLGFCDYAPQEHCFTRHCIMSSTPGIIKNVEYSDRISDNLVEQFVWWKKGDEIVDEKVHKLGIAFLRFGSMNEMLEKTENMQELIKVRIE